MENQNMKCLLDSQEIEKIKLEISELKQKINCLDLIKDSISRLTYIQESQEKRNEKFQSIYEEQIKINTENSFALKSINNNLSGLNVKLGGLERNFISSENESKIDTRVLIKNIFLKVLLPVGGIGAIIIGIIELISFLKP